MYNCKSIHKDKINKNIISNRFKNLGYLNFKGIEYYRGYFSYEVNGIYYIRDRRTKKILHKYNEEQYQEYLINLEDDFFD